MRAPCCDCSTTQVRRAASVEPSGSSTAGTTTTSGFGARPEATSANVWVGTIAGPPSAGAGAALAATVQTENIGELANPSNGPRASLPIVPEAPRATATTKRADEGG